MQLHKSQGSQILNISFRKKFVKCPGSYVSAPTEHTQQVKIGLAKDHPATSLPFLRVAETALAPLPAQERFRRL